MLPDAEKTSKRIYPLLQNTDLENLAYSTLQSTAQPIAIEELNEDELRRLVLVNLARLSVKGEWDGLLTSSSGGSATQALMPLGVQLSASYPYFQPTDMYKITKIDNTNSPLETYCQFFRFVAPKTGTISTLTMRSDANNSGKDPALAGIYDTTDTGYPKDLQGYIEVDLNGGAGLYSSTSWSSSVTLTAGTTYWFGVLSKGTAPPTVSQTTNQGDDFLALGMTHYPGTPYNNLFYSNGSENDLPSTFDFADATLVRQNMPHWVVKYS